jgi:hypothetical protein
MHVQWAVALDATLVGSGCADRRQFPREGKEGALEPLVFFDNPALLDRTRLQAYCANRTRFFLREPDLDEQDAMKSMVVSRVPSCGLLVFKCDGASGAR